MVAAEVAMRHIPSYKTLRKSFGSYYSDKELRALRALLVDWRDEEIKRTQMLETASNILKGYGVEYLRSENGRARAYYVNMGDTYETTLVLDIPRERIWITSWGDWVEAEERDGNYFA